jgi:hypothetical protein
MKRKNGGMTLAMARPEVSVAVPAKADVHVSLGHLAVVLERVRSRQPVGAVVEPLLRLDDPRVLRTSARGGR